MNEDNIGYMKRQEAFNFIVTMATIIMALTSILNIIKEYELVIKPIIWIFNGVIGIIIFIILTFILCRIPPRK